MTAPLVDGNTHAVYTGRTTRWAAVAATCGASVLLVLGALSSDGAGFDSVVALALLLAAAGVLADVLTASSVRATAGPNGFTVRWGVVGWPRCSYSLDRIARADVVDLPWWRVSFGFWWTPWRTSCTVRSGPAVRLVLDTGRVVTVTVPEPEVAVAALRAASGAVRPPAG